MLTEICSSYASYRIGKVNNKIIFGWYIFYYNKTILVKRNKQVIHFFRFEKIFFEIKTFSTKKVKVPVSSSIIVEKTKTFDHDFKKDNLIDFAYSKVKNIYNKEFGSENVKDFI